MLTIYDEWFKVISVIKKTRKQNERKFLSMKTLKVNNSIQKISRAQFASKVDHIDNVDEDINFEIEGKQIAAPFERYAIEEMVIMNNEEFSAFTSSMMAAHEFIAGKGGTSSTTLPASAEGKTSFLELTEDERNEYQRGAYRKCVGIATQDGKNLLAVDPQGYEYARYVAIIK